jgi:hypothetical protein
MTRAPWLLLLLIATGCLDLRPTVVPAADGASATSAACLACIGAPDSPGPGCADELATCSEQASCERGYRCSLQDGCYSGAVTELPGCARRCAEVAGVVNSDDPSTPVALELYQCIVARCRGQCFAGTGTQVALPDAGPPDASTP